MVATQPTFVSIVFRYEVHGTMGGKGRAQKNPISRSTPEPVKRPRGRPKRNNKSNKNDGDFATQFTDEDSAITSPKGDNQQGLQKEANSSGKIDKTENLLVANDFAGTVCINEMKKIQLNRNISMKFQFKIGKVNQMVL